MIPRPASTLTDLAIRLATHLAPEVNNSYGQADAGLISALLLTMAQDYERSVFNPMQDIEEIKVLAAAYIESTGAAGAKTGSGAGGAAPSRDRALAFMAAEPASLHLNDVTTLHDQALELLIDMHSWAETADAALNDDIWLFLRRHSERNKFEIPGP